VADHVPHRNRRFHDCQDCWMNQMNSGRDANITAYPRLKRAACAYSVRTWVAVLYPLSILPITQPKMVVFHDLGNRRVEKAMSVLIQPGTTVVWLPSFFKAMSTTAFGCINKRGLLPGGQNSD
jgi:hypothetical protein